jgi:hypothetical protein
MRETLLTRSPKNLKIKKNLILIEIIYQFVNIFLDICSAKVHIHPFWGRCVLKERKKQDY